MPKEAKKEEQPETKAEQKQMHVEVITQTLTLATSGFGLVAALAWNNVIQEFVNSYVKKWIPGSGLSSLLLYALLITLFAVLITVQLSKLKQRIENK